MFLFAELAEVSLLLEELIMMVPAIQTMLMGYIVGGADDTASMSASETSFMIRCPINCHLKDAQSWGQETIRIVPYFSFSTTSNIHS
jgi:hypothetical protein